MSKRYCLYLTDHYLSIDAAAPDGLRRLFTLSFEEMDYADRLQAFLKENSLDAISIFIDVMGEEVKHENIPHINPKDRQRLIQRKLKSLFPGADLIWKQQLKREESGRRDDIFLFLGINLPETVHRILDVLIQTEQTVSGIYFLPLLQQQVINLLPETPQQLIISGIAGNQQYKQAYRQTFFKDKALAVSRVNTTSNETSQAGLEQLFKEIERTYQFLEGSRQLNPNVPLSVIAILSEKNAAGLISQNNNQNIDLKFAGLAELGSKLGVTSASYQSLPELLCHLAIHKNLKPHFQPVDLCRQHRAAVLKQRITLFSAAMVLISALLSGGLWLAAEQTNAKYNQIAERLAITEQQRHMLAEQLPDTPVPPSVMHQSVQLYEDINRNSRKPEHLLPILARAYQGFQDLDLKRITWVTQGVPGAENTDDDFSSAEGTDFITALRAPTQLKLVVSPDPRLGTRNMLARVDSFSSSLQQQPEISRVILEKSAIDTRSSAQLEESFGGPTVEKTSDFTLLITL